MAMLPVYFEFRQPVAANGIDEAPRHEGQRAAKERLDSHFPSAEADRHVQLPVSLDQTMTGSATALST